MIITATCKNCGKTFQGGRIDVKTCSNKCRNALSRTKTRLIVSQQQKIVTAICWKCKKTVDRKYLTPVPFVSLDKYYNLICNDCGGRKMLDYVENMNKINTKFLKQNLHITNRHKGKIIND